MTNGLTSLVQKCIEHCVHFIPAYPGCTETSFRNQAILSGTLQIIDMLSEKLYCFEYRYSLQISVIDPGISLPFPSHLRLSLIAL
ncbi:hypothetical protein LENED_001548 [Lentinula edodes]|uniref:Uncharacterized protein n=1 Tax=Lentinula edodes TaxID=5353 RepID=A0A1Q3DYR6_LENED|nr:hypothetical protein LENED_001548 [Lentinula edodes]